MKKGTLLIHNGHEADPVTGALGVALYQTSTFFATGYGRAAGASGI
jgi:O-acetylhomoserine/O-acetylserine sulfhydrylase-like pyridoxal-dependent enzyme